MTKLERLSQRISLAPMIDKTEPRFRYLLRQLFPELWLYTEMISSGAIIHGEVERFLALHPTEHPVALQLGTHCPREAYQAVRIAREYGSQQALSFAEYNLNVGCPSDRVQNRNIGAILMNDAPLVAEILAAMRQAVDDTKPLFAQQPQPIVTLKHRLGIEQKSRDINLTSQRDLYAFIEKVTPQCDRLIAHARIAILDGLDPKQNREIPPLDYPMVFALRRDFSSAGASGHLAVDLNGGLKIYEQIAAVWPQVDGVMLGRVTYEDTWELFGIRRQMLSHSNLTNSSGDTGVTCRSELVGLYADYLETYPSTQSTAAQIWPLQKIWHKLPGARSWRRLLSPPYPSELQDNPHKTPSPAAQLARRAHDLIYELEQKYQSELQELESR